MLQLTNQLSRKKKITQVIGYVLLFLNTSRH